MGRGHLPVGHLARLVGEEREMERLGNACQQVREVEAGGGGVNRIAAEDQKGLDRAGLDRGAEIGKLRGGLGAGLADGNGRAEIAKGGIDPDDEGADRGGLLRADKDKALTLCGEEIVGHSLDPGGIEGDTGALEGRGKGLEAGIPGLGGDSGGDRGGEVAVFRGPDAEAVVGHAAGDGEVVLRHVETVHRPLGIAALGKAVGETEAALGGVQEIAADREDHIGFGHIARGTGSGAEHGVEGLLRAA